MKFPSKEVVARIRKEYPMGTRIELLEMDDFQAPPVGTQGTRYRLPIGELGYGIRTECDLRRGSSTKDRGGALGGRGYH